MIPAKEPLGAGPDPPSPAHENEREFEYFYYRHFRSLVRYLASLSGSARFVDDAAQEAMLVVANNWTMLGNDGSRRGYLFVTAKRELIRMLKRPESWCLPLDTERHDTAGSLNLAADWIESNIDVTSLLQELTPRQREAATLAWLCDFSEKQIAQTMGVKPGTVKAHLSRARRTLRCLTSSPSDLDEPGRDVQ